MLKLNWSNKLFDVRHFFALSKRKFALGWELWYRYRLRFMYSLKSGICLRVKQKHFYNNSTSLLLFTKYKRVNVYLDIAYFLSGMLFTLEEYNIANKLFKCSRLSKKRIFKV